MIILNHSYYLFKSSHDQCPSLFLPLITEVLLSGTELTRRRLNFDLVNLPLEDGGDVRYSLIRTKTSKVVVEECPAFAEIILDVLFDFCFFGHKEKGENDNVQTGSHYPSHLSTRESEEVCCVN